MGMMKFIECSIEVSAQHYRIIARFEYRKSFFCRKRNKRTYWLFFYSTKGLSFLW